MEPNKQEIKFINLFEIYMKTKFTSALSKMLFTVSAFMLLSGFTFSTTSSQTGNPAYEVILKGKFSNGIPKSLTQDFIVTVDANFINIFYLTDYVDIAIEITDESGQLVYFNYVDPETGKNLLIDISNWQEGSYHISFTNNSGGCVYGDFDVIH